MKLKSFFVILSLLAAQFAWAEFNPHVDTLRLGNKQSTATKQLIFDINQGANDPQISCSDTTGAVTVTSGSSAVPFTFPTAVGSAGYFLQWSTGGATSWAPFSVVTGSIAQADLATRATGTTVAAGGFASTASSSVFSTTSSAAITNFSLTITTTGRPVMIGMYAAASAAGFVSGVSTTVGTLSFQRGGTNISVNEFSSNDVPCSSFHYIDAVAAGTYTYTALASVVLGSSVSVTNCFMYAYEL